MNEEFEKWFQEHWKRVYAEFNLAYPMNSFPKKLLEVGWNASREVIEKEKRFGCYANQRLETIYSDCLLEFTDNRFPRQVDCLINRSRGLKKTDCPYWREIK